MVASPTTRDPSPALGPASGPDAGQQRRGEERLRRSEAGLAEAQALVHLGSWELDLETHQMSRSDELWRIYGFGPEHFGTTPVARFEGVHPDDRPRFLETLRQVTERGGTVDLEYHIRRVDGAVRLVHTRGRVVEGEGEGGSRRRLIGTTHDITERREMERRLALSERMASLGELAAGVAHELNNPLTFVLTNLDGLARRLEAPSGEPPGGRALLEMVASAQKGAEQMRQIVRSLKTFSRVSDAPPGRSDVRASLELSLTIAMAQIRQHARLVREIEPVPLVMADEGRLGQVFTNLLVNAVHAIEALGDETGQIRVATRAGPSGEAIVEIEDSGGGIPPELRGRIFDPFFTTKPVGTGLGLSIAHSIVTSLGGAIEVESEVGRGSLFRVSLPAAPA